MFTFAWTISSPHTDNLTQIHARLGEILYISTANLNEDSSSKILVQSIRRFCRSVELCDDYIRGYYGLKIVRAQQ